MAVKAMMKRIKETTSHSFGVPVASKLFRKVSIAVGVFLISQLSCRKL